MPAIPALLNACRKLDFTEVIRSPSGPQNTQPTSGHRFSRNLSRRCSASRAARLLNHEMLRQLAALHTAIVKLFVAFPRSLLSVGAIR
jgi:hypothetical protein